jgi:hypothetical protein
MTQVQLAPLRPSVLPWCRTWLRCRTR